MSFDMEVEGYDSMMDHLDKMQKTMPQRFGTYLEKLADEVVSEAKSNLQNNKDVSTGDLLASIKILNIAKEGMEVTVGSDIPYAKYIEYGRGPVFPKNVKFLSWIDKDTGKRIFSKKSSPVDPHPFLEPAVISKMQKYPEIVVEGENQFMGGLH
jgi:HK97 gp10 family phage protein